MPLGGVGAGYIGRSSKGDFNLWHIDGGEHTFKSITACQFSVFEQQGDRNFLERVFQRLLLNFTWWVNREDPEGKNVFEGGFLCMDNIGVFDRSAPLPTGGSLQ